MITMKNLIFMIPLVFITAIFLDGKSQSDINFLTKEKLSMMDSMNLNSNSKEKLPKFYYLDTTVKEHIDTLIKELEKTEMLETKLNK